MRTKTLTNVFRLLTAFLLSCPVFAAGCQSVTGDWDWFTGGVVTFASRNGVLYNGTQLGTWTCTDPARNTFTIRWTPTGYVDTITISGNRASGKNNAGVAASGTRRVATQSPIQLSQFFAASYNAAPASPTGAIVLASGLLQRCLGITPGAPKMMRGPATQPYCKQLPGADLYDQAGARFQAGDHAGAASLVTRSAETGNAVAQLRLALLYDQGDGVVRSSKTAFLWYSRAAAQGEPESLNQVGAFYELGEGVRENWDLAVKYYQASASEGWHKGQFSFGRAYQFGIGVPQDRQQAIAWFQKAAAQGNGQADYFAKWLRDPTNNIGFRDDFEHDLVIGSKLRFGTQLMGGDASGVLFHNSAQRVLWLRGQRNRLDREEAEVFRQIRTREHEDCVRAGRDNCIAP